LQTCRTLKPPDGCRARARSTHRIHVSPRDITRSTWAIRSIRKTSCRVCPGLFLLLSHDLSVGYSYQSEYRFSGSPITSYMFRIAAIPFKNRFATCRRIIESL
jgi:hypothetical protein